MKLIIDINKEVYDSIVNNKYANVYLIESLKNGTPIPDNATDSDHKTGKWITEEIGEGRKVYCSECKESAVFEYVRDGDIYSSYGHGVVKKTQYCPNCGANRKGVCDMDNVSMETIEQIKAEIREKSKFLKERAKTQDVPEHILTAHGLDFALDIINEHLSELKPS